MTEIGTASYSDVNDVFALVVELAQERNSTVLVYCNVTRWDIVYNFFDDYKKERNLDLRNVYFEDYSFYQNQSCRYKVNLYL